MKKKNKNKNYNNSGRGSDIRNRDDLFLLLLPSSYSIDVDVCALSVRTCIPRVERLFGGVGDRMLCLCYWNFPRKDLRTLHYIPTTWYTVYIPRTRYNKSRSRRRRRRRRLASVTPI